MKSVLISINPKWCEKIISGEKTIEVRKSAPKETPFKVYIYCTKDRRNLLPIDHGKVLQKVNFWENTDAYYGFGKIIGEFICDKVYKIESIFSFYESYSGYNDLSDSSYFEGYSIDDERLKKTCLTRQDLYVYGKEKTLYGWLISELKIYGKPKKLSEFKTPPCDKPGGACGNCKWLVKINTPDVYECECYVEDGRPITRPPQSYMWVTEIEDGEN